MFFWFFLVKIDVGAWGGGFVVLKGDYIRPGWRDWRNKGEGINELCVILKTDTIEQNDRHNKN